MFSQNQEIQSLRKDASLYRKPKGKKQNNFFQIILFSFILEAKSKLESICPAGEGAKDKVSLSFSDSALNCVE